MRARARRDAAKRTNEEAKPLAPGHITRICGEAAGHMAKATSTLNAELLSPDIEAALGSDIGPDRALAHLDEAIACLALLSQTQGRSPEAGDDTGRPQTLSEEEAYLRSA